MTAPIRTTYSVTVRTERSNPETGRNDSPSGYHVARDADGNWRAYGKFVGVKTDQQLAEYLFHKEETASIGRDGGGDLTIEIYQY